MFSALKVKIDLSSQSEKESREKYITYLNFTYFLLNYFDIFIYH